MVAILRKCEADCKIIEKINDQQQHQNHKTKRINNDEFKITLQMPTMQLAKIKYSKA
jgi:hypothetical protein